MTICSLTSNVYSKNRDRFAAAKSTLWRPAHALSVAALADDMSLTHSASNRLPSCVYVPFATPCTRTVVFCPRPCTAQQKSVCAGSASTKSTHCDSSNALVNSSRPSLIAPVCPSTW